MNATSRVENSLLAEVSKWGAFVKFSHTIFALPFALASMALAARDTRGWPGWQTFSLILLAMVCARTCAMAFNRIVDRDYDKANPRTASRHLPKGEITLSSAWTLCVLSAVGFVGSAYLLNPLCFYLSPVALFLICFYSLTKRFTNYSHVWLGLALALAPLGAWLAVRGEFTWLPLRSSALLPILLALAVIFWLVGFDIIYAIQDCEFDRRHGLHSLAVAWGPRNALVAACISHMIMWKLLFAFGLLCRFRVAYFVGLLLIAVCLALEHWLARRRSTKWINAAFFKMNAVISTIFVIVTVAEIVFPNFRIAR